MGSTSVERRIRSISDSEIVVGVSVEEFKPKFETPKRRQEWPSQMNN